MTTNPYITEEQEDDAMRTLRASYWQSVRNIADDVRDELARDHDQDENDMVFESVDSSQWIIYTWRARLVRSLSDHEDAYYDFGVIPSGDDLDAMITAMASYSMIADVTDVLHRDNAAASKEA